MEINCRKNEKLYRCLEASNQTYGGKTLIIKNVLISQCGNEIEKRGIADKYIKYIYHIMWSGKANQISRNVCCLETNEGGRVC